MKVEDNELIIESEIGDENVDEFLQTISDENIKKVVVKTPNLGASIIQLLLVYKRKLDIVIEDDILKKVFENVIYKSV